ncbi:dihydrodipicolinate synthase family protein [Paenibacillus sp. LS1]|uniref:dihydrodipicolinate synthase family protein n=1 Tax=Paenibacillus sp. LS1 TaxID=2992120 RepID=UPI00222F422A|nr:dihydrodipicolinate synthase family protein [Paenibacillus sp. LS1]MCW3791493.1 dihydrodipicolinate synthase family protein [Paenibacillus sp. LS1]
MLNDTLFPDGVWPVMLTPFTEDNEIDYTALEELIEWYLDKGVHGLFAVCLSSEMLHLSLQERVDLAKFVVEKTKGRVPVVASGHNSDDLEEQITELTAIAQTGVDAVILVTSRIAGPDDDDEVWKRNLSTIMERLPDVKLGLYECPIPYHRLLSPELLKWCADSGRFFFLKETSCDLEQIRQKVAAVQGTPLKIYNANGTSYLRSLQAGAHGYSGILTNFHPDLYVWIIENWQQNQPRAERLQTLLGPLHLFEGRHYPVNAKYLLQQEGLKLTLHSRARSSEELRPVHRLEVDQFLELSQLFRQSLITKDESFR